MKPEEVWQLARSTDLDHEPAIIATAIAWGESGLRPEAVGDENLADEKWGPSIGLWQIRSLNAQRGTGGDRDADALPDPEHNARAMCSISNRGTNWQPWTIYRNGAYRQYLDRVRAAVEGRVMQDWHPRATFAPAARDGVEYVGVPWKIVLHTTESKSNYSYDPNSYYGHQGWPHATIDRTGIYQHIALSLGGRALYAYDWPPTNRANAIQCEIVWRASEAEDMPDDLLAHVADWVRWVSEQTGAPLTVCPQGFHGTGEGIVLASEHSPIRFESQEWLDFSGICGHQHVPSGNDHWDPGRFPIERCLGISTPSEPSEPLTPPPDPWDDFAVILAAT